MSVDEHGYGAACAGALTRLRDDVEIFVFMDADGSDDPAEIPLLITPIRRAGPTWSSRRARWGTVEPGALTPLDASPAPIY